MTSPALFDVTSSLSNWVEATIAPVADPDLTTSDFALSFKAFIDAMTARAMAEALPRNALRQSITAHIGEHAGELPVIGEEFDTFEQPNIQVAMES